MTVTSTSSTAALAYAAGVGALFVWPLRRYLRVFRWSVAIVLIVLHLSMQAPVWALIGHIDLMGGSSSYHRYELINQAILHFWDWYLVGEKTTYQWGFNLWDTANTYVETAVTGGLSTLLLFVSIVVCCFGRLGKARKKTRNRERARLNWSLGAALFSSAVGFIGITYYDQASVEWYSLVALICTATMLGAGAATKTKPVMEPPFLPM
jgi:O-antigen ligase